jgi:hypothetical protein
MLRPMDVAKLTKLSVAAHVNEPRFDTRALASVLG